MSEYYRILVVEDEPVGQLVIMEMLRKLGYQADLASNGLEAVKRVNENFYHLIFMDCFMPVMDGLQATRLIRELESREKRPQSSIVIALTARALTGDREALLEGGMDDYLPKPLDLEHLRQLLTKHLGKTA